MCLFYYDTIMHAPAPLRFLKDLVGSDRLLTGTDFPFRHVQDLDPPGMYQKAGFTDAEVEAISVGNCAQLFTRLNL